MNTWDTRRKNESCENFAENNNNNNISTSNRQGATGQDESIGSGKISSMHKSRGRVCVCVSLFHSAQFCRFDWSSEVKARCFLAFFAPPARVFHYNFWTTGRGVDAIRIDGETWLCGYFVNVVHRVNFMPFSKFDRFSADSDMYIYVRACVWFEYISREVNACKRHTHTNSAQRPKSKKQKEEEEEEEKEKKYSRELIIRRLAQIIWIKDEHHPVPVSTSFVFFSSSSSSSFFLLKYTSFHANHVTLYWWNAHTLNRELRMATSTIQQRINIIYRVENHSAILLLCVSFFCAFFFFLFFYFSFLGFNAPIRKPFMNYFVTHGFPSIDWWWFCQPFHLALCLWHYTLFPSLCVFL